MHFFLPSIGFSNVRGITDLHRLIRDIVDQKVTPTCPHGRPLMVQLTRTELEKRFRRIQQ